jgi:predicted secreted Zn-dependent protease
MKRLCVRLSMFLALLASCAWHGDAMADTVIHKKVTYFSIGGNTAADIDREMMRNGPLSSITGRRHPGATQIRFTGSATYVGKKGRCHIGDAKVVLSTKIMLPRWANRKKASKQLALIWDTLSADIKRHEERHAEIARNHARELEKSILSLPPQKNCTVLKDKVARISQQAMDAHDRDQRRFDRVESINFEKRMIRLLKNRLASRAGQ